MTILIYETAATTDFLTVYRDSDDPQRFYYIPQFCAVSKRQDGRLNFGARLFKENANDPNDGFAIYNFGVTGVTPSSELQKAKQQLESDYGLGVKLSVVSPDADAPTLVPYDPGIYRSLRCQARGANLYTDLGCSFTIDESLEPDMSQFFQDTAVGWRGAINFAVRTKKTEFSWTIKANWYRIQEHFKSQLGVKYWFVNTNISYETKKLVENDLLEVHIEGGTPSQREEVHTLAEKIAARLFQPTIQPSPLPAHPRGAKVCFSLNYSHVEENRTSTWKGSENAYEVKELGIAAYVGDIPAEYFSGYEGLANEYSLDDTLSSMSYVTPNTGGS